MLISQYIKDLQALQEKFGDLEIGYPNTQEAYSYNPDPEPHLHYFSSKERAHNYGFNNTKVIMVC